MAIAAALLLGLVGGLLSALAFSGILSDRIRLGDAVSIDDWHSNWSIGTDVLDPYTKAWVSRYGLFALRRDEAVYFNTKHDSSGQPLKEGCTYTTTIPEQPGEWWSLTAYNSAGFLPKNADASLSFDALKAADLQTRQVILTSTSPAGEDAAWVSTRGAGTFDLTLRVYLPTSEAIANPEAHFQMPAIDRVSCAAGQAS